MKSRRKPTLPITRAPIILALVGLTALPAHAQFNGRTNAFQAPAATLHYARTHDYDLKHVRVELAFDVTKRFASGQVTHTLAPLRAGLTAIVLDAGKNLKITRCAVNGTEAKFTHEGDILSIAAIGLPASKDANVTIQYEFSGAARGGGANGAGGIHWIEPDATPAPRPNANPNRPNRRAAFSDSDRRLAFWTQGETEGNRLWVPIYDAPNDKTTSETITTVPETWTVIGNGVEGKTTHDSAKHTRTYHWTMKQPHSTYLLSLVAGELDIKKTSWQGVPLYYIVPKGKADLIDASFEDTPDMLSFYSQVLGVKYVWPKYAQSAMFDFPGGMENVSATTLGASSLTDYRSGIHLMASLTSHELAHQWFGDYTTCKDWGEVWLNESFATYMQMAYFEHAFGKDAYDRERESSRQQYLAEATRYKRPLATNLYANPDVMFDSHTYPKGGLILHMLRRYLGDEDFYKGLNYYLKTNGYTPVDSHDLSKAFEVATGKNVDAFFDQWIYKPGHPEMEAAWKYDDAANVVVLTIKQTQDTTKGTPIYNMPVTIGIIRAGSTSGVERQTIQVTKAEEDFRLSVGGKPDAVLVDPDHDLLKTLKIVPSDTEIIATLKFASSYIDRLNALTRLQGDAKTLSEPQLKLVADLLPNEANESVSATMIGLLAKAKNPANRALFREQAKSKQIRRRAAALSAIGQLPNPEKADIELLRAAAMSDKEMYTVVEAGMTALARLDLPNNLDVFRHQLASKSLRDTLLSSALTELIDSKSDAASPVLLEVAQKTTLRAASRARAVRFFKEVQPDSDTVNKTLLPLLKEDTPAVQLAVIETLQERKDTAAVPALSELATSTKNQDVLKAAQDAVAHLNTK